MSDLLIHSMAEFASLIRPCLERAKVANVVEIGAEFGGMSTLLADHCRSAGGTLTSIDPAPQAEFLGWLADRPEVRHIAAPSLEVLDAIPAADAWVIDGDHNYYTVRSELALIDASCRAAGKPLLALLHDVDWPCARRDFYYAPERIPEAQRHPYSYAAGVHIDQTATRPDRGLRGMGQFAVALHEGGPGNGVLTAVEDFLAAADSEDRPLVYAHIPAVLGLGVIMDATAEWAEDLAGILLPFHRHELLARLEQNRLRNYLAVIDWQDRTAASAAR